MTIYNKNKQKVDIYTHICPVCGSRQTGKIGLAHYFCHACLVEFNSKQQAFRITENGLLLVEEVKGNAK